MPFYEYECSSCGKQTEVLQKISDAPLKKCPNCGKSALKRLISAPVFRLKGSGWYETDFKSDQDRKRNLAGSDDAPVAKSDEAKPETKVEAKSDAKDKPAVTESKPAEKPASTVARSDSKKSTAPSKAPVKAPAKAAKSKPVAKKKAGRR
ncbi:MAG: zinc ribbon domain-containing protein [Steroidobacteraceae bacterium]